MGIVNNSAEVQTTWKEKVGIKQEVRWGPIVQDSRI